MFEEERSTPHSWPQRRIRGILPPSHRAPTHPAGSLPGIQRGGTNPLQAPKPPLFSFVPSPGPPPEPSEGIVCYRDVLHAPPQGGPPYTQRGPRACDRPGNPSRRRSGSVACSRTANCPISSHLRQQRPRSMIERHHRLRCPRAK